MATMANGVNGSEVNGDAAASFLRASDEESQILATIDRLRDLGIDRQYDHDLPQIIVCGSQSAGKSSVLEAIVGVPFPRSENTCTKYVTEVTVGPGDRPRIEVRINPSEDRPPEEIEELRGFHKTEESNVMLANFMSLANKLIFKGSTKNDLITKDILLVTISGPGTRPLQLLDLPGLIAFDQRESGNDTTIEDMVTKYMDMKQSIILAVIKASEDLNNQKVLKLCRKYDPTGERTLGVITRPDIAEEIQKAELIKVMLGKHPDFQFSHRWHVLRNRTSQELKDNITQQERDRREQECFSQAPWNTMNPKNLGIVALRTRLREMLFSVAKKALPGLLEDLKLRLETLQKELDDLGRDEFQGDDLEKAFGRAIQRLRKAASDHARGIYESDIRKMKPCGPAYLRSRVDDASDIFWERMVKLGHAWKTCIRLSPQDPDHDLGPVCRLDDTELSEGLLLQKRKEDLPSEIIEVAQRLDHTRGSALPTFTDPHQIDTLFWLMSDGWDEIANDHVRRIYTCCTDYFRSISPIVFSRRPIPDGYDGFGNSTRTARRFVDEFVIRRLDESREKAEQELRELEADRKDILLNHDIRFLKDRRSHRQSREFQRALKARHELDSGLDATGAASNESNRLDQTVYAQHAGLHTQHDLTEDTAETYLDAMWSHYQIDREVYIANVLKQVVERHFLRKIEEVIPVATDFDLKKIKHLLRRDNNEERQKHELEKEINVVEHSIEALRNIY